MTSPSSTNTHAHMPWIDLLRFLAAFTVVVAHARAVSFPAFVDLPDTQKTLVTQIFYAVTRLGHEAVIVFFVLSGYLVGGKVLERLTTGGFVAGSYAIDRFSRLYVPLVPALLLTVAASYISGIPTTTMEIGGNLFSMQGVFVDSPKANGPLWSLSYEVWFYVLAGALAVTVTNRSLLALVIVVVVLMLFTALKPHFLFCWAVGALAYILRPKLSWLLLGLGMFVAALGVVLSQVASESRSVAQFINIFDQEVAVILLAFGLAIVIQQIVQSRPAGWASVLDRCGTPIASGSYTLYLTHYPILVTIGALGWQPASTLSLTACLAMIARIILCLALAWAMYMLFERHTSIIRRWLKAGWYSQGRSA